MNKNYGLIGKICLWIAGLIIAWDVFLCATGQATISGTALYMAQHGHFAIPFMCGALMAHLFIPWKKPKSWLNGVCAFVCAYVIILDRYVATHGIDVGIIGQYPMIAFIAGMPAGMCFQQMDKA